MSIFIACVFAVGQYPTIAPEPVAGMYAETAAVERFYPVIAPSPVIFVKQVLQIPQFHATGGPHWTHPDSIESHLRNGHGVNPAGMSQEQMLSYHDALHEGRVTMRRQAAVAVQSGGCPGGICPLGKRR